MCLDVDKILSTAEGIYHQIVSAPHLNDQIRVILGHQPLNVSTSTKSDDDPSEATSSHVNGEKSILGQDVDEVMYQIGLDMNF